MYETRVVNKHTKGYMYSVATLKGRKSGINFLQLELPAVSCSHQSSHS